MTRRSRRREQRDWWAAAVFVALMVLLIFGAETQLARSAGDPENQFASLVLRGLMIIAAGMALAAVLPEPEREYQATRRFGFWLAALVPLVWLVLQWLAAIVGGLALSAGAAWLVATPLPAFWLGVVAGVALRQVLGR